jgi:hypothetical protein
VRLRLQGADLLGPGCEDRELAAEIANDYLVMKVIIGMFFQDCLTRSAWCDWALYSAVRLRLFKNELGGQVLVCFRDLAGVIAGSSSDNFAGCC